MKKRLRATQKWAINISATFTVFKWVTESLMIVVISSNFPSRKINFLSIIFMSNQDFQIFKIELEITRIFIFLQAFQVLKLAVILFGSAAVFHAIAILFGASVSEYV